MFFVPLASLASCYMFVSLMIDECHELPPVQLAVDTSYDTRII